MVFRDIWLAARLNLSVFLTRPGPVVISFGIQFVECRCGQAGHHEEEDAHSYLAPHALAGPSSVMIVDIVLPFGHDVAMAHWGPSWSPHFVDAR